MDMALVTGDKVMMMNDIFPAFRSLWGWYSYCNKVSAMGKCQAWRPWRVQPHLFKETQNVRVSSTSRKCPRAFSLVCKLAKQCHHSQSSRERQTCENEGRQRRWIADCWPCSARKESALSPGYFQLSILRDDHSTLVCLVLPDEGRPEIKRKKQNKKQASGVVGTTKEINVPRENLVTAPPWGNRSR